MGLCKCIYIYVYLYMYIVYSVEGFQVKSE